MKIAKAQWVALDQITHLLWAEFDTDIRHGEVEIFETPVLEVFAWTFLFQGQCIDPDLKGNKVGGAVIVSQGEPGIWNADISVMPV